MEEAQSYLYFKTFNEFVHNFFLALFLSLDALFKNLPSCQFPPDFLFSSYFCSYFILGRFL